MNKIYSICLVVLQIASIMYLAITGDLIPSNKLLLTGEIIFILFGFWAMAEIKFRFNIFPSLLNNSTLITSGPFKFVRHPMYTSTILITLTWLANEFSYLRLCAWILLVIILNIKTLYEEKILDKEFSDYKTYRSKTRKLIPFIY